ncbi:MAG: diguanylate cyclase [Acidisphaera sp.]|nr:diguanylate cyclase [Acidisphaera sp.]
MNKRQRVRLSLSRLVFAVGMRARLMLLTAVTALPLLALLLVGASEDRRSVLQAAQARAVELARVGAEQEDDSVQEARVLLDVLSRLPEIRSQTPEVCTSLLRGLAEDHPRLGNLTLARADGSIACSSRSTPGEDWVSNRSWFQQAMAQPGPALVISGLAKATNKPTVVVAKRLGPGEGAIAASLDLSWFSDLAKRIAGGSEAIVLVVDPRDGAVLAGYPDPDSWRGKRFGDPQLAAALHDSPVAGSIRSALIEGSNRVIGFAPLPAADANMTLVVGLDRGHALAEANYRLRLGLTLALSAAAVVLFLASLLSEFSQQRPIEILAGTAARLGNGDFAARAPMPAWQAPEFRILSKALNAMAAHIEASQSELARSEALHRALAESSSDMITRMELDGTRTYVSPSAQQVAGWPAEELIGRNWPAGVVAEDRPIVEKALQRLRQGEEIVSCMFRTRRRDGHLVWLEKSLKLVRDPATGAPESIVANARDVTSRKMAEEALTSQATELKELATTDSLTGLANRRAFDQALDREWRRAIREERPLALLMLDIDYFKALNDRYGHQRGDVCLSAIATAIANRARRPGDLTARYGGEEFAVLLPDSEISGALIVGQDIRQSVRNLDLEHTGSPLGIATISVGVVSMAPQQGISPTVLIERADAALYAAKRNGRNRVEAYEETAGGVAGLPLPVA